MPSETVLIIEDDPALLRGLRDNFAFDGYNVLTADDGQKGLQCALTLKPDLIVLDLMLPHVNGYEICRYLRKQGVDVPIIMLTAKGQESDKILGLNLGADDYVTKPFSIKELLARANAFLRRNRQSATFSFDEFLLDRSACRLTRNGKPVELTPKEFAVLELLIRKSPRALSRDEIIRNVWGRDIFVTARSVDRCITTLRSKIPPAYIQTVREIGYRFDLET